MSSHVFGSHMKGAMTASGAPLNEQDTSLASIITTTGPMSALTRNTDSYSTANSSKETDTQKQV